MGLMFYLLIGLTNQPRFVIFICMKSVQISKKYILREDGRLFNVKTGEEYVPTRTCQGYYQVSVNGKRYYIHHLVMKLFGKPKPGDNYQIDHRNKNRLDNNITNLRWVTQKENQNNRTNNRPLGKRLCDYKDINEYKREYQRERRRLAHKD